jgi:hypothetical protein
MRSALIIRLLVFFAVRLRKNTIIPVIRIEISITMMLSSMEFSSVPKIIFLIDENIIIPHDHIIISHSITAAIPSIFQCQ